jgi:hypothetical protein
VFSVLESDSYAVTLCSTSMQYTILRPLLFTRHMRHVDTCHSGLDICKD